MSDDDVGYGKPPKSGQFPPGKSGNPRGRPRKPRRALFPSQIRKDFLREIDKVIEVKTSSGIERITMSELVTRNIVNGAAKMKPTALKMYEKMQKEALDERINTYAPVRLTELLQSMFDDPATEQTSEERKLLDDMIKYIKKMY